MPTAASRVATRWACSCVGKQASKQKLVAQKRIGPVSVTSRRGTVETVAKVTGTIKPGVVFMPFHYVEAAANELTNSAVDPVAKIPELKACAVRVAKRTGG